MNYIFLCHSSLAVFTEDRLRRESGAKTTEGLDSRIRGNDRKNAKDKRHGRDASSRYISKLESLNDKLEFYGLIRDFDGDFVFADFFDGFFKN